jgi:hypothetical protein
MKRKNRFEIFLKVLGWHCISFGIHIDIYAPRIEIHLPFCWIRVGWSRERQFITRTWEDGLYQLI